MTTVESLEPHILAILTAPAVDLDTVSAKRVRAQLKVNLPKLEDEWVRKHKGEIDALTATIFDRVRAGMGEDEKEKTPSPPASVATASVTGNKRKRSAEEEADAEYARKLASELNGHNTRKERQRDSGFRRRGRCTKKKKSKPKKAKKQDDGDGEEKKKGGYQKEYALSPALAAFTGVSALSRPQIVKRLWDHIKANNLQNPQDKREILCDDQMKGLFNVDKINMFQMNKVIGAHIVATHHSDVSTFYSFSDNTGHLGMLFNSLNECVSFAFSSTFGVSSLALVNEHCRGYSTRNQSFEDRHFK
ncbi:SWIB protein [Rhizoctonia solani]|uniref:SWIB protein n=1 Tax=Rhizoctonia solani TaxID=456999 RepID=A0A8H7M152_9AGAM|nr:SWIB protein [Rhizoctonia solani]